MLSGGSGDVQGLLLVGTIHNRPMSVDVEHKWRLAYLFLQR